MADSPGLEGYEPERIPTKIPGGYQWLKPLFDGTEAEKLRLELWCMNERRKRQAEMTRFYSTKLDAAEGQIAALQGEVAALQRTRDSGSRSKN